ncbi:MAG: NAD(P)-binding domain-containing protein [Deltaproteobacteria bacterium]|nr:NAD(P)-binding domain-containing protein [Deltaproteobacteria bacterium]
MSDKIDEADYTRRGTLKVDQPAAVPDVVDVFVAGGGPAGTAAAVRCKELGLSCLVVDYDDLMKRIRDYPKEKQILPSYGGGDKLQFPAGGPMLAALAFDDIDKDDLVKVWKAKYKEYGLTAKIGHEFTGLDRLPEGVWSVRTWNHRTGEEERYQARNVLLAIGAGVPRRFDIPGNTDGIAFRLDDAKDYVGRPALVIGGGTSAAEAVIAISGAKIAGEDQSAIYWSYRGGGMPKVSRALSEVFFSAYVGNGNVRYLAFSEPVAVVTADDKLEYLSVRIDRKISAGRPCETVHLEFAKDQVVACIGEDLPVKLLQGCGIKIPLLNNRPQMLVNHDGEVSLPGVFLVGDARGPKYLRCKDFDDAGSYEQVVEKRNIKAAMVDAVKAVEAIALRAGMEVPKSEVAPTPTPAPAPPKPAAAAPSSAPSVAPSAPPPPVVVPPAPSHAEAAKRPASAAQLVSLHPDDSPEEAFPLTKDQVTIGRKTPDIACADDVYMADTHALLTRQDDGYALEDESGGAGVWLRAKGQEGRPLVANDLVWIGAQILMVVEQGNGWAVTHFDAEGVQRETYPIPGKGMIVGRVEAVSLDKADLSLSRRHAQLRIEGGALGIFDLGSKNGTYVKLTAPTRLANGDEFRVASKRFRFERFAPVSKLAPSDVVVAAPHAAAPPAAAAPAAPAPAALAAATAGGLVAALDYEKYKLTIPVAPDQDLLHAYFHELVTRFPDCKVGKDGAPRDHHEEPLDWECKIGQCGLCTVEIIEGAEHFVPPDPGGMERPTIEKVRQLDWNPVKYRLACVAKIKGPVKLTIPPA